MESIVQSRVSTAPPPARRVTKTALRRIPLVEALGRVAAISLAIVTLIFAGLTLQMSLGGDPALGSKVSGQSSTAVPASSGATTTASTGSGSTSAISAALAAQAQAQVVAPAQSAVPTPAAVAPTRSPPPTPVQTSTS